MDTSSTPTSPQDFIRALSLHQQHIGTHPHQIQIQHQLQHHNLHHRINDIELTQTIGIPLRIKSTDTIKNNINLIDEIALKRTSLKIEDCRNNINNSTIALSVDSVNEICDGDSGGDNEDDNHRLKKLNNNNFTSKPTTNITTTVTSEYEDFQNRNSFICSSNEAYNDKEIANDYNNIEENGNTTDITNDQLDNQNSILASSLNDDDYLCEKVNELNMKKSLISNLGNNKNNHNIEDDNKYEDEDDEDVFTNKISDDIIDTNNITYNNAAQHELMLLSPNEEPLARRYAEVAQFKNAMTLNKWYVALYFI